MRNLYFIIYYFSFLIFHLKVSHPAALATYPMPLGQTGCLY